MVKFAQIRFATGVKDIHHRTVQRAFIGDENASCAPALLKQGSNTMQLRRFKNISTFPDPVAKEATRLREEAETKPRGPERDALLRKARQADTAAHIDEWLSSPGLRAPT
jgi:hypothetical protein